MSDGEGEGEGEEEEEEEGGTTRAVHTEVVRTPHSWNFSKEGVGALGVSMNSNSDSLPLVLWGFDIVATKLSKLPGGGGGELRKRREARGAMGKKRQLWVDRCYWMGMAAMCAQVVPVKPNMLV